MLSVTQVNLRDLQSKFRNPARLAEIFNVHKSSVGRWLKGEDTPERENEEKIAALRYILVRLNKIYTYDVATDWLFGINAFIGNQRPIDLIKRGRISEVIAAIEQTEAGSYV